MIDIRQLEIALHHIQQLSEKRLVNTYLTIEYNTPAGGFCCFDLTIDGTHHHFCSIEHMIKKLEDMIND